jgi:hypothetical protein
MKKNLILSAFAALAFLTACSQGPYTSKPPGTSPQAETAPAVFLDKDLRRVLSVVGDMLAQRVGDRLKVQVALRNRTNDETLHIEVQTVFFNANGQMLYNDQGNALPWIPYTLTPNQTVTVIQTSLTGEAASAQVRVRYSQKIRSDRSI